jgi:hypothetical protein
VCLSGEEDLHRAPRDREQRLEPLEVVEDEHGALVGGKATREPDGQGMRVEQAIDAPQVVRRQPVTCGLHAHAFAYEADQPLLLRAVGGPEIAVRKVLDALPELAVGEVLLPVR